jgi:hypothetical protein
MFAVKLSPSMIRVLRPSLAVMLMLWCAGTGCLLVSYAHAAGAGDDISNTVMMHLGAGVEGRAGTAHTCCKARHSARHKISGTRPDNLFNGPALSDALPPANSMSCCPLTSGAFLTSAPARTGNKNTGAIKLNDLPPSINGITRVPSPVFKPAFQDQSHSHARNCVFLI